MLELDLAVLLFAAVGMIALLGLGVTNGVTLMFYFMLDKAYHMMQADRDRLEKRVKELTDERDSLQSRSLVASPPEDRTV